MCADDCPCFHLFYPQNPQTKLGFRTFTGRHLHNVLGGSCMHANTKLAGARATGLFGRLTDQGYITGLFGKVTNDQSGNLNSRLTWAMLPRASQPHAQQLLRAQGAHHGLLRARVPGCPSQR